MLFSFHSFSTLLSPLPEQITFALFYCPFLKHTLIFSFPVCFISTLFWKKTLCQHLLPHSLSFAFLAFLSVYLIIPLQPGWNGISQDLSIFVKMKHQENEKGERVDNGRETGIQNGKWEKGKERREEKREIRNILITAYTTIKLYYWIAHKDD